MSKDEREALVGLKMDFDGFVGLIVAGFAPGLGSALANYFVMGHLGFIRKFQLAGTLSHAQAKCIIATQFSKLAFPQPYRQAKEPEYRQGEDLRADNPRLRYHDVQYMR